MQPSNDGNCEVDENFLLDNDDIDIDRLRSNNKAKTSNINSALKTHNFQDPSQDIDYVLKTRNFHDPNQGLNLGHNDAAVIKQVPNKFPKEEPRSTYIFSGHKLNPASGQILIENSHLNPDQSYDKLNQLCNKNQPSSEHDQSFCEKNQSHSKNNQSYCEKNTANGRDLNARYGKASKKEKVSKRVHWRNVLTEITDGTHFIPHFSCGTVYKCVATYLNDL